MIEDKNKVYVRVFAKFDEFGDIMPISMKWTDGRVFHIDRVLDVIPCRGLSCGGEGVRYTCRIADRKAYLFFDRKRWYIDRKSPSVEFSETLSVADRLKA